MGLPTAREQTAFNVLVHGSARDFVQACREVGLDPATMLDRFEAQPFQWLIPGTVPAHAQPFPPTVRHKLEQARRYVGWPQWRRVLERLSRP